MKKLILIALLLMGCSNNVKQHIVVNTDGEVEINGKTCTIVSIDPGDVLPILYYVDCPNGSSVTYNNGESSSQSLSFPKENVCCEPKLK